MKRICKFCKHNISDRCSNTIFCNNKCSSKYNYKKRKDKVKHNLKLRKLYKEIIDKTKNCEYCNKIMNRKTIDHIIPYSIIKNKHIKNNIAIVCLSCNCSKGNKDFIDWAESKDYYIKPYLIYKYIYILNKSNLKTP